MSETYKKGRDVGVKWVNWWMPGGPFFCDDESRKINDEWLRGFKDGLKANKSDIDCIVNLKSKLK